MQPVVGHRDAASSTPGPALLGDGPSSEKRKAFGIRSAFFLEQSWVEAIFWQGAIRSTMCSIVYYMLDNERAFSLLFRQLYNVLICGPLYRVRGSRPIIASTLSGIVCRVLCSKVWKALVHHHHEGTIPMSIIHNRSLPTRRVPWVRCHLLLLKIAVFLARNQPWDGSTL
jgi:hypothetical protein